MILIHGTNSLLGKTLLSHLLEQKTTEIVVIQDDVTLPSPANTLVISTQQSIQWIRENGENLEACILLDNSKEEFLNQFTATYLSFFKQIWRQCLEFSIPFLYTSTYETYGEDGHLCEESEVSLSDLNPTSPFGQLKHTLDQWIVNQPTKPYFWASLKLSEYYDPAEVPVFQELQQGQNTLWAPIVSVRDIVHVIYYLLRYRKNPGIYHITSNQWLPLELIKDVPSIDYSVPLDGLTQKYNFKTNKLRNSGYMTPFHEISVKKQSTVFQA